MENSKDSSFGCLLLFSVIGNVIWLIIYWEEFTNNSYWPYILVVDVLVWAIILKKYVFDKKN